MDADNWCSSTGVGQQVTHCKSLPLRELLIAHVRLFCVQSSPVQILAHDHLQQNRPFASDFSDSPECEGVAPTRSFDWPLWPHTAKSADVAGQQMAAMSYE